MIRGSGNKVYLAKNDKVINYLRCLTRFTSSSSDKRLTDTGEAVDTIVARSVVLARTAGTLVDIYVMMNKQNI